MGDERIASLTAAVEGLHGGSATFERFERVTEHQGGGVVWEGDVAVFALEAHPTAKLCYAWSEPVKGTDRRRFFAVLHHGAITSPAMALRASILKDAGAESPPREESNAATDP